MAKRNLWLGILVLELVFGITVVGCVSNYNIQTFSNEVRTLPTIKKGGDGTVQFVQTEGMFTGSDYESALIKAKEAGFTEILSIEYGTRQFLGIVGLKWVTIRCK